MPHHENNRHRVQPTASHATPPIERLRDDQRPVVAKYHAQLAVAGCTATSPLYTCGDNSRITQMRVFQLSRRA